MGKICPKNARNQTIICNDDDKIMRLLCDDEIIVSLLDSVGNVFIAKVEKSQHADLKSQVTNISVERSGLHF